MSPKVLLGAIGLVLAVSGALYAINDRKFEARRRALQKRSEDTEKTLGIEWARLRDRLEGHMMDLAKPYVDDYISPKHKGWNFRTSPGLYVRAHRSATQDPIKLRSAILYGQRDGVAGCLLETHNDDAIRGVADAGAFAEQPWNLRRAYESVRVLDELWRSEVVAAKDMQLRVLEAQFDVSVRDEIPLALRIVKEAEFFLFVVDEELEGNSPSHVTPMSDLQRIEHPVRIGLVNMKSGELDARLRIVTSATATYPTSDEETRATIERQANNCAIGRLAKSKLE